MLDQPDITGVPTSIAAFVGRTAMGPLDQPLTVSSLADFERSYGGLAAGFPVSQAVSDFFQNGGSQAIICRVEDFGVLPGDQTARTGIYMLENVDIFNLLCIPWDQRGVDVPVAVWQAAAQYCYERRAMVILDPPSAWTDCARSGAFNSIRPSDFGIEGDSRRNASVYFPKVERGTATFPPCGAIAGIYAATDAAHGVWKAPAGPQAVLNGIDSLEVELTDEQNGVLNAAGVNCLRTFPVVGTVVWGARTLIGSDAQSDDYRYVNVRRLALYIEESVDRGTKFAVFEPNAQPLWTEITRLVSSFLIPLRASGAFYDYFVSCDQTTTTPDDIAKGICNIVIKISPVYPDEFIVLTISQRAGAIGA